MHEFIAPNCMVHQAKWLKKERGVLESVATKPGNNLPQDVAQTVGSFYENDKISRIMPRKKDCFCKRRKWR